LREAFEELGPRYVPEVTRQRLPRLRGPVDPNGRPVAEAAYDIAVVGAYDDDLIGAGKDEIENGRDRPRGLNVRSSPDRSHPALIWKTRIGFREDGHAIAKPGDE